MTTWRYKDNQENEFPLSPVQQGMFFHYIHKKSRNYLEQMICTIEGDLDIHTFEATLGRIIDLHSSLRTIFLHKGKGNMVQKIKEYTSFKLDYRDLSEEATPHEIIDRIIEEEAELNLDLNIGPCRSCLFKVAENNFVFLCTYHHLILDSWAIRILENDFCEIYLEQASGKQITKDRYSYKLYLDWIEKQDRQASILYWKNYLLPCSQTVPSDLVNVKETPGHETLKVVFDFEIVTKIHEVAQRFSVTPNTVILAVWGIFVLNHYQQNELLFGCVTTGRMIDLKYIDKIVGLFVNSVPLYVQKKRTVRDHVRLLQKDLFMSAPHTYMSLSDITACGNLRPDDIRTFINFSIDSVEINNSFSSQLPFRIKDIRYNEQANYEVYADVFLNDLFALHIHFDPTQGHFNRQSVQDSISQIIDLLCINADNTVEELLACLVIDESLEKGSDFNF